MSAFPHYNPGETEPRDPPFAVGYAYGSLRQAIRHLEAGRTDWALKELRRALAVVETAIEPELRDAA